ncbi:hypothetical protein DNTS_033552 [Danionella cerebrum]|uniref:Lysosomal-associated membrane protein 1 n=1 Tax=Danionella cerebrum TaxID=2873325 RepID=A0A553N1K1_9TELE|nr:hypothetical protein DNTS_033552 [Danionella translucida]
MIPVILKQNMPVTAIFSLLLALNIDQTMTAADPTSAAPKSGSPPSSPVTPGPPERGSYNVTNANDSVCLLAQMGLQLNISYFSNSSGKVVQELLNLDPNQVKSSGSCDPDQATLSLAEDHFNLTFTFSLNSTSNKYHLSGLELFAALPDMSKSFEAVNTTLKFMLGTLGHSYMCQKEKALSVTQEFTLNTFQLQVQPFGVNGDFGAAEECELDEDDMLIPIIVGAALAVLVLIVIMAYLVGRNRSRAGYQTI